MGIWPGSQRSRGLRKHLSDWMWRELAPCAQSDVPAASLFSDLYFWTGTMSDTWGFRLESAWAPGQEAVRTCLTPCSVPRA